MKRKYNNKEDDNKYKRNFVLFDFSKIDNDENDEEDEEEEEKDENFYDKITQEKVEDCIYELRKIILSEYNKKNSELKKLLDILEFYEKEKIIIYDQDTDNDPEKGFGQVISLTTKSKLSNSIKNVRDEEYKEYQKLENLHDEGILFCRLGYFRINHKNYRINFSAEFPYINENGEEDFKIIEEIVNQNIPLLCYEIIIFSLKEIVKSLKRKNIRLLNRKRRW